LTIRSLFVALLLWCFVQPASAQVAPAQVPPAQAPQAAPAIKPPAKKPAAKVAKQTKPPAADSGPCRFGVIVATDDLFTVQKIGLTVFGNDYAEVPVNWGFDDLIFARARAAFPCDALPIKKGAFDAYFHPKPSLFRNGRGELTSLIRQIAGNAGCESYLVVLRAEGVLDGTNQRLTGVGVVNRGTSLLSRSYLLVYLDILVFDGQTFEIRRDPTANLKGVFDHMAANLTTNEHLHEIDNTAFPASAPDAANSATLRDGARGFLTERLDQVLPAYFTTDAQ
jgi:hypothetical protein